MKKISVSKGSWRHLCRIKNDQNLTSLSKTIDYLIFKEEKLSEIQDLDYGENIIKSREKDIVEIEKNVDLLIKNKKSED